MPSFQDIELVPGVNTQFTLEANKAGISVASNIRYKNGLIQKLGGWNYYFPFPVSTSPIRDVHAFQGLASQKFLGFGATAKVGIISCGILSDITPQTTDLNNTIGSSTSNFAVILTSGSNVVEIQDPGSSASQYSGVYFTSPLAVSNLLLFGAYAIASALDANHYTINTSAASCTTLGASQSSAISALILQSTANSAIIDAFMPNNQFLKVLGLFYNILPPSSFNGGTTITLAGLTLNNEPGYQVTSIIDSTHFQITGVNQSSASSTNAFTQAFTHYYNVQGPPPKGGAYGGGNYSAGPYGIGPLPGQGTGTPVAATDWLLDNTGEVLMAVQENGPIYQWAVDQALSVMQPIYTGPKINLGGFVSQPQQIFMCFGSEQFDGGRFTGTQDPLLVRWSDSANINQWVPLPNNFAGGFRIPTGSTLLSGVQAPLYAVFLTDIDIWTATWAGQPLIWSFTRVGTACGAIGKHAVDVAGGTLYWCGQNNLYTLGEAGVTVLPCSVWDFLFQNIDRTNQSKVRAASNAYFNEVSWFFPIAGGNGENGAYIKVHIGEGNEYEWDYGVMSRTAWVDTTVLGAPIGSDNNGNLFQHEQGFDGANTVIDSGFETGYFAMGDGTELALVDWVIPDIRWQAGSFASASVPGSLQFTFFTTDYPAPNQPGLGGPFAGERVYGPFLVTQATQFINTRMRGRFWRCKVESTDMGSFWRLGNIKFRWGPSGSR